jgi:hypothetical protein|tara:strand:- start:40 stop:735 length:696 start_codon:yes stop_codon:yes gene_type:complete
MKGYIYSEQIPMFGHKDIIGYGTEDFYVKEIERNLANKTIIKNHYSKKVYNGTYVNLGVFIKGEFLGVLQYGYAMNPASGGSLVTGTEMNQYLELNRMWIADDVGNYPESKAISYSIKYIKGKLKTIKWIQSFADERCGGLGIVYQACSFRFYGEHISSFWELDGETFHNSIKTSEKAGRRGYNLLNNPENKDRVKHYELRQFRYIKFLDKRWIKRCTKKEQPYLKHYNND